MGYVYHGSKIAGMEKLETRIGTHQKPWVYAIKDKAIATIFIAKAGDLYYCLGGIGTSDDPYVLIERKAAIFDEIFNVSGSLYYLDDKNFKSGMTQWNPEVISEQNEIIIKEEPIENVWEKLTAHAEAGELQIYRYPDRPSDVPIALDNSDLIPRVIEWHRQGRNSISKFLELYPELKTLLYDELENKGVAV